MREPIPVQRVASQAYDIEAENDADLSVADQLAARLLLLDNTQPRSVTRRCWFANRGQDLLTHWQIG